MIQTGIWISYGYWFRTINGSKMIIIVFVSIYLLMPGVKGTHEWTMYFPKQHEESIVPKKPGIDRFSTSQFLQKLHWCQYCRQYIIPNSKRCNSLKVIVLVLGAAGRCRRYYRFIVLTWLTNEFPRIYNVMHQLYIYMYFNRTTSMKKKPAVNNSMFISCGGMLNPGLTLTLCICSEGQLKGATTSR